MPKKSNYAQDIKLIISALAAMSPSDFAAYTPQTMLERIAWQIVFSAAEGERASIEQVIKTLFGHDAKVDRIVIAHEEEE